MPGAGTHDVTLAALAQTIDALERAWFPAVLPEHPEFYEYQSTPVDTFVVALQMVRERARGNAYLEVGCGIGTKLVIAQHFGFEVHAIEARAQYVATAQFLCPEATIKIADARHYDNYGAFDVIFCYRPLISDEGQAALDEFICGKAKSDAVLLYPYRNLTQYGWAQNAEHVWERK